MLVLLPEANVIVALRPDVAAEAVPFIANLLAFVYMPVLADATYDSISVSRLSIELTAYT